MVSWTSSNNKYALCQLYFKGKSKAKQIKARGYVECSAKESEGVIEVLEEAVEICINPNKKLSKSHSCIVA